MRYELGNGYHSVWCAMPTIVIDVFEKNKCFKKILDTDSFLKLLYACKDIAWFLIHTRDFNKCLLSQNKMEKERRKGRKEREKGREERREGFEIKT